jgi:hypothetical protein
MKTLTLTIAAILLFVACNKSIETTTQQLQSKEINKAVTTYYLDTTYKFRTEDDNLPFDSCTNEYVALHGQVRYGYLIVVEDSVMIKDSSWLHYDSVYGVGQTSGRQYKYKYDITSKQTDLWRDSCYFQTRNYYYSHLKLATKGADNDFVVSAYIKVIADKDGNILTDSVHYNNGECR